MTKSVRKPKVSILVPIYNVEKYLAECLDSLINQTLREIEIICIDDGSTDKSPEIIKKYAAKDSRIVVITKKNSGYGDSMNQGLAKAAGDFIGIVESDDCAKLTMFEDLYELAVRNNVEVVKSDYYNWSSLKNQKTRSNLFRTSDLNHVINPIDNQTIFLQAPSIWAAIYRHDFLTKNDIDFLPTPGASYQDTGFNFKVWAMAKRVYFTDKAYLYYRIDNESSSVKSLEKVYNVNKEYASIEKYLEDKKILSEVGPIMEYAKFGAYYWNLNRLPKKLAREFLDKMGEEYRRSEEKGILDTGLFDPNKRRVLKIVMHRPQMFFFARTVHRVSSKVKSLCRKTLSAISPGYRRGRHIMALSQTIITQNETLSSQIAEIEDRMNKMKSSKKSHGKTKN